MAELNEWWAGDPAERFWLEVTDRDDLGANLHAPQLDDAGNRYWSYNLVAAVKPGDVVFHWWKRGSEPAIVAASVAVGDVADTDIVWTSHGSYGRTRGTDRPEPGWLMPLADFRELDRPVTLAHLREQETLVRDVRDRLSAAVTGPLYFPFALSDKRPLRPAQGYLLKLPADIVWAFPRLAAAAELEVVAEVGDASPSASQQPPAREPRRRPQHGDAGYLQDTELRRALERHAVDWTLRHFERAGYIVEDVGATQPYDVRASADDRELHIEVKGSSGSAVTVELTDGEVGHHRTHVDGASVLVVVDEIRWERTSDGIRTTGGRQRIWEGWEADQDSLVPTRYRYTLP